MFDPQGQLDGLPKATCPVCDQTADKFLPFGAKQTPERRCPSCGSLERHRAVWLYFERFTDLFTRKVKMLHAAPEPCLMQRLRSQPNIDYLSIDLKMPSAMAHMDLTDLDLSNDAFDVVYASHVLEHIPDDRKAMREFVRVLKPGG